ncbi:MAG: hypothetical protein H6Q29_1187 [Bacteroidetes bacterium]|nr:hypothetical protein [Bacteroidota bacterium]
MAGEREHMQEVLRLLESRLASSNRPLEAGRIGLIRQALSSDQPLDAALEALYGVQGYDRFALRLMWYAEKGRDPFASMPTPYVVARHAEELLPLLPADAAAQAAPGPPEPKTFAAAVDDFGAAMEAVKRAAFSDGQFSSVTDEMAAQLRSSVQPLGRAAALEENREVTRFADAVGRFLDLVRARSLAGDVRVVNLLDSANLTLQTAMQTHAPEDFDSLQEITRLLENPLQLFEQPPPAAEQA